MRNLLASRTLRATGLSAALAVGLGSLFHPDTISAGLVGALIAHTILDWKGGAR